MVFEEFARADEALIGRVIAGKFELRRCVGIGASGAVYEADQLALGRTVAIKILRPDLASVARFESRFQDEARAASRLNHPNIVSVIDYGQTEDGLLYLVMEFLRGLTLTHILQQQSRALSATRIADVISQVLAGLEEAHESGVVHADLKSDNIMVEQRRNGWDLVKVVDFGIARLIGRQEERTESTICGTPEYMAPEIIRGSEPAFASDLYAVGIVLYELMTGVTPFAGTPTMHMLTRHLKETPQPPSERAGRKLDPVLEQAAMRALAKAPGDRFASAAEFRAALAAVANRTPAAASANALCGACGVESSSSFKFCPECGHPREPVPKTQELGPADIPSAAIPILSAATAATQEASVVARHGTRRFEVLELDHSAGGMLPLPMVGRDALLGQLERFIAGRTAAPAMELAGPEGSGRSRLVIEACSRAVATGSTVFITGPDPSGLASPFYPIRAMVAGTLGLPPVCTYEDLGDALEGAGLSRRDLPGLAELFGHSADLAQLEPPIRRRELLVSAIRALAAPARHGRTVLVFEDVERYDQPSFEVVQRLTETPLGESLRVLITRAPEAGAPPLSDKVSRVDIGRLPDPALDALGAHLSSRARSDMPTAAGMMQLAGGHPGHILQLVRFIVEGGSVDSAPRGLADLISARLDHLPAEATRVCQAAAVFGNEVQLSLLAAVTSGLVNASELRSALSLLEARGILSEQYEVIRFEQQLVRDVVYESIPANTRLDLHRDAGLVLEQQTRDAAVLGHHAELAGKIRRAAELLAAAGDAAVRQLDDRGAIELYTRALSAARELMLAEDERQTRERFVSTSVKLADALRAVGRFALARGIVSEARAASSELPLYRVQLSRAAAHLAGSIGETDAALAGMREAIGQAIMLGNGDLLIELYLDLAALSLGAGQSQLAATELEEGIDLVTGGEGVAADSGPRGLWYLILRLGQLRASLEDPTSAIALGEHAARHAERAGSRVGMARASALLASQYEKIGNMAKAETAQRRAVDAMRLLGDRRGTAEVLLSGARPSRTLLRITPWLAKEARELAAEVGWDEGVRRAERLDTID